MEVYRKHFMSHRRKAIYYGKLDGTVYYMVAKGDGTDKYFSDWKDAMDYIDKIKDKKKG